MKHWIQSLRMLLFMTLITGAVYPLAITGISQAVFSDKANGSLLKIQDTVVGSELIGEKFESPKYFWPRPSAISYAPLPSSGTNLGQTSAALKTAVDERRVALKAANPESGEPPQDLLFASSSGLDPHISPEAAKYQAARVAKARALDFNQVQSLVDRVTEGRQLGILGEPRVNVLALNIALDKSQGIEAAPVLLPTPTPSPQ